MPHHKEIQNNLWNESQVTVTTKPVRKSTKSSASWMMRMDGREEEEEEEEDNKAV
jgi:hypothetical protein